MATTLPRPPLPSHAPPTSALPPLPPPKPRKSLPASHSPRLPVPGQTPSKLAIRTPSSSAVLPSLSLKPHPPLPSSIPARPSLRSTSSATTALPSPTIAAERTVRRTISIAAFPQPPKSTRRIPRASGVGISQPTSSASSPSESYRRFSGDSSCSGTPVTPATPVTSIKSKLKFPAPPVGPKNAFSSSPSLLNGSGDLVSISAGLGQRGSDGLLSLPSPGHSRTSSAQGSYSTSATTFEDIDERVKKGRDETKDVFKDSKHRPSTSEESGNVIVSVRVRPDAGGDIKSEGEWMVDGRKNLIAYRGREGGEYHYDNVFAAHDQNSKVYDVSAKRLVRRVMEGYNGTVFAYGMTGTGKTFSMQGTFTSPGVIPLAIADIFAYIRETPHREFLLRVSYLEIYNEKIHDLLSPAATGGSLQEEIKLREDSKGYVYATPLKEEIVQSPTQLLREISKGDQNRRTGSTQFNARSSRSHAVVQIVVESRERVLFNMNGHESKRAPLVPGGVRVSTLSLIDLAGSERAADSKDRRTEGAHINKSLLTLGTVIARLSGKDKAGNPTDKDGKHLPYRDSKLTRLLQPALSGNSLISILCTIQIGSMGSIAAANNHTGETLNTLKFAARAKNNILSHAKRAEEAFGDGKDNRAMLELYKMEIHELRNKLDTQARIQEQKEEKQLEKEEEQRRGEQLLELQLARTALKERISHLNKLILSSQSTGVNSSGSFSSLGMHPRLTAYSTTDLLSRSARSSQSHSTLQRTASNNSNTTIGTQIAPMRSPPTMYENDHEGEENMDQTADGHATVQEQNRALQTDLATKTRYISTLEKRLDQARRSSQSRTSSGGFSPTQALHEKNLAIEEKDAQIADLRSQLRDKEIMVAELRAVVARRNNADLSSSSTSPTRTNGHKIFHSNSSSILTTSTSASLSPVELLSSPQKFPHKAIRSELNRDQKVQKVDDISRLLDEMLTVRVAGGETNKSERRASTLQHRDSLFQMGVPTIGALNPSRPTSRAALVDDSIAI